MAYNSEGLSSHLHMLNKIKLHSSVRERKPTKQHVIKLLIYVNDFRCWFSMSLAWA